MQQPVFEQGNGQTGGENLRGDRGKTPSQIGHSHHEVQRIDGKGEVGSECSMKRALYPLSGRTIDVDN